MSPRLHPLVAEIHSKLREVRSLPEVGVPRFAYDSGWRRHVMDVLEEMHDARWSPVRAFPNLSGGSAALPGNSHAKPSTPEAPPKAALEPLVFDQSKGHSLGGAIEIAVEALKAAGVVEEEKTFRRKGARGRNDEYDYSYTVLEKYRAALAAHFKAAEARRRGVERTFPGHGTP